MRIGLNIGYGGVGNDSANLELVQEADRIGFSVVWVAEAYGADAATVLAWLAARTERVDLGSAILQIPARSPTMTAMTAATLDTLSGGRFRLGLGVSGPQVSEGWYGVPFAKPLERTREYVEIVGKTLRYERVRHDGPHFRLPIPGGPGKALSLTVPPVRERIPLYLASLGPKNLELTGEIADGWLGLFFSPEHSGDSLARIRAGRAKIGASLDGFDVVTTVPLAVGDDWRAAAEHVRPYVAGFVGGAGSREHNFYRDLVARMGYEAAADEVRQRYLTMDYDGAMAAIPAEFLDATSLVGPKERIADRMRALAAAGVTTLAVSPAHPDPAANKAALHCAAEALDLSGVGD
ncbi:LLM class F420-dependent oxidoreductase [Amycolatopsis jiangsuensis]|uniref:F420-dependent oxidoreductase-like protein n=1 Tax=Amycolatopsis jiangsuensis TaxID=1181879 RepID=A0A840J404_9PSEU|nr:LLM class F420-dependent oxidoreductase [Amycolatopsis jiangsuensis]MBB4688132.1 F420-dependent oxidoreductase-like protein [Amycolatopsis jiangsuensis]